MRIRNTEQLQSVGNVRLRKDILDIAEHGLEASDPYFNTMKSIRIENGHILHVGSPCFNISGAPYESDTVLDLDRDVDRIFVLGAGKGIQRIAQALEDIFKERITGGIVILKKGDDNPLKYITALYGSHPIPDECCIESSKKLLSFIEKAKITERDIVFTIIGNGSSSLLTLPPASLSLLDVQEVTRVLQIERGMTTPQVNLVRNQIDLLKGGRLTRIIGKCYQFHLVSIDLEEPNALGGVGFDGLMKRNFWIHCLPDCTSPELALSFIKEKRLGECLPRAVIQYIENEAQEHPVLTEEEYRELGCRIYGLMPHKASFLPSIKKRCRELGYKPYCLTKRTFTEASVSGELMARIAVNVALENEPFEKPCAIISTGEFKVTVDKAIGIGGRNQEFVLSAAPIIRGYDIAAFAVDTDGTDGPGGSFSEEASALGCFNLAGGLCDGETMSLSKERKVDIEKAIETHDTSSVLWKLDSGVWMAHSISVQDLVIFLIK